MSLTVVIHLLYITMRKKLIEFMSLSCLVLKTYVSCLEKFCVLFESCFDFEEL